MSIQSSSRQGGIELNLDLPPGWVRGEPPRGIATLALAPQVGPFVSNLTVAIESNGSLTFEEWQVGAELAFTEMLPGYVPVDLERLTVGGHQGGRRLSIYAGPNGEALTMEQWFVAIDGTGYTMTATVLTREYVTWADALHQTARSWVPV